MNVGDLVECIDDSNSGTLVNGTIYKIRGLSSIGSKPAVYIEGSQLEWFESRFKPIIDWLAINKEFA